MSGFEQTDLEKFREIISTHSWEAWDIAWKQSLTPWDAGKVQPPLSELISSGELSSIKGRALVPGCGRGYDAVYIAKELGLNTVGIDLSESAVKAAESYFNSLDFDRSSKDKPIVKFKVENFFDLHVEETDRYDLIYDYTFFCAIPPSMRTFWGQQMTRLAQPNGLLATLAFPIDGDRKDGPPYSVSVEAYADSLGANWRKLVDKVPAKSSENHEGRERIMVWRKT